jgi:hypothetical protein
MMQGNANPRPQASNVTLLDGMIAVAGIAISLWLRPVGWETIIPTAIDVVAEYRSARLAIHWSSLFLAKSQLILAVWTLTVLVLGLRQHRRPLRRLASQPGIVACGAVALTMLILGPLRFINSGPKLSPNIALSDRARVIFAEAMTFEDGTGGIAVAVAWMVLVLGGRWRPRPTLIERTGQVCGYLWIAMIPIAWLRRIL